MEQLPFLLLEKDLIEREAGVHMMRVCSAALSDRVSHLLKVTCLTFMAIYITWKVGHFSWLNAKSHPATLFLGDSVINVDMQMARVKILIDPSY